MLPLFEQGGGGKAKRGIDRVSVLPEQVIKPKKYVIYLEGIREVGQTRMYGEVEE